MSGSLRKISNGGNSSTSQMLTSSFVGNNSQGSANQAIVDKGLARPAVNSR